VSASPPIPISHVAIGPEEEQSVLEVLRSGMLAQGPKVAALEAAFADVHQVKHVVAVNNGTTALVAAMQALQIGPGDEVITTPFSFVATLNAILEAGARVRFADILDDYTIDPAAVGALIGDRTRVLMPVHLYGLAADLPAISALADRHGLGVVEDAAQAHGASIAGRPVGNLGIGTFSLYGTKNVMCGEGGLVTTNDDTIADRLRLLRNQGMRARYQYEIPGHNYRLTDVQAAIALPQVHRLEKINAARQANAERLTAGLAGIPGLVLPPVPAARVHVWHQYTVRLTDEAPMGRDEFSAKLTEAGIGNGFYYPRLMHDYDCYRDHPLITVDETPHAAQIATQVVSLPVHPALAEHDLERIVGSVRGILTG
jgi:perosamine synthetase